MHHMVASHTNILQRVATILKHKTTCHAKISLSFLKCEFNLQKVHLPAAPKQQATAPKHSLAQGMEPLEALR